MGDLRDGQRRRFLRAAAVVVVGALGSSMVAPVQAALRLPHRRSLALYNLHTGEAVDTVYWADGRYLPEAMRRINWLLRDYRTDEVHPIDPELLDLLGGLRARLHSTGPLHVISGYRSPATNAMLANFTDGVARNSLHMQGKAVDIRVPGRNLSAVHHTALAMRAGGVGYYPHSDFVHIDVGRIRRW